MQSEQDKWWPSKAKRVGTKDMSGKDNGYIVELAKDGELTTCYMTVAFPGCFKGYHTHKIRASNYVCIKGKANVHLIVMENEVPVEKIFDMDASQNSKLHIPTKTPTAISNPYDEEAWMVNFPNPPYDPSLKDEQIDLNFEDSLKWVKDNLGADSLKQYMSKFPHGWDEVPVRVARCVNCNGLTLNPQDDTCACGNELHPVTRLMLPGATYYPGSSGGDENRSKYEGPRNKVLKNVPYKDKCHAGRA